MNTNSLLIQARSYNTVILSVGLTLLFGGLLAEQILGAFNWWNIVLIVLGLAILAVFLVANLAEVKAVGKKRATVVRANLTLVAVAMVGIVIGVNYIVSRHPVRFDMTSNKIYTLSDQTLGALKNLAQDVDVTMFTSAKRSSAEIQKAQQLLEEYSKHSNKFHFKVVDGDKNPAEARQLKVTDANTVVFMSGDNRKDVLQRDYVTYALQGRQPTPKFQGEGAFTSALMAMTDSSHLTFYFTEGHGEKDFSSPEPNGFNGFKELLEKQNYTFKTQNLLTAGKIPDDASVLGIMGPDKPFQPSEVELIKAYLLQGGKLVLCIDPMVKSGLDSLLKDYGIKLGNDMVVDPTMSIPPDPRNVVPQYQYHAIVEKLSDSHVLTIMPFMRSVQKVDPGIKGANPTVFMQTTANGWGVTDFKAKTLKYHAGIDTKGPVPLAIASELVLPDNPAKKARVVAYGGSNFLSNQFLQAPGNGDVGLNTFSWAAEEENKISIHPKDDDNRVINLTTVSA
ncbi:MAG TPA: GldG family protein, partial [bacterium]|nr:GldG family protein [bacterium]